MASARLHKSVCRRAALAAVAGVVSGAVLYGAGTAAFAQQYPIKPVRIVASEAGGGGDIIARTLAQGLSPALGQQFVIDNRGGGVIAGDVVARSAPDGYTFLLYGNTLWVLPLMRKQVPYDPHRDFAPITLVTRAPTILVVHPSIPAKSVKELIAFARARPGQLNYGSAALGTSNHLAAELFKYRAKVDIVRVGFRGTASAFTSVLSGQVHVMFTLGAGVLPTIQAGKVRALAVTSAQPSPLFPGMATVASAGFPGFELLSVFGFFAPAGTPPAILARMNQEIVRVLQSADTRERLVATGVEATGSTPEALAAAMQEEVTRMREVITAAGIREE